MGKTLYLDCFSGASGDMMLGALLDLGLPLDALREALGSLAIDHGEIGADRVVRAGVSATKFRGPDDRAQGHTHHHPHDHDHDHGHGHDHDHDHDHDRDRDRDRDHHHHHPHDPHAHGHDHGHAGGHEGGGAGAAHHHAAGHGHHSLADITRYVERSALSAHGKARALDMFRRLAEAEAAIHGMPVEQVHLHEVGAVDSIVDIVGAVFGMEWLGASEIVSSPLNVGSGTVRCAHGVFPVPAPATARLLEGIPVYASDVKAELTTPTGALLVTAYAQRYGPMPLMRVDRIGYGAGTRDFPQHPNVLRMMVGESGSPGAFERIITLECEIDDMNPQLFGPLMDRLYASGALDVFYAPVQMKKNRPGTLVTVIATPERRDELASVLFADTTTIGVRFVEMQRERLDRDVRTIDTPVGPVRFKIARREGKIMNASPEFEDCARIAGERGLPIKEVQAIAVKAWLEHA